MIINTPYEILFSLFFNGDKQKTNQFLVWAIGADWSQKLLIDTPELWNARHGDKLQISAGEDIMVSIAKMVALYNEI